MILVVSLNLLKTLELLEKVFDNIWQVWVGVWNLIFNIFSLKSDNLTQKKLRHRKHTYSLLLSRWKLAVEAKLFSFKWWWNSPLKKIR